MWKTLSITLGMGVCLLGLTLSHADAAKDADAPGKKIFVDHKCTQCHSIDALKIAKVKSDDKDEEEEGEGKKVDPPDLSDVGKDKDHTVAWITKWLMKEEKIEGRKHKKKFKGTDEELKTVSEWLVTLKYDVPKKKGKEKDKDKDD